MNKVIGNISSTTYQSITSNQNTLVAKQYEKQLEDSSNAKKNHWKITETKEIKVLYLN